MNQDQHSPWQRNAMSNVRRAINEGRWEVTDGTIDYGNGGGTYTIRVLPADAPKPESRKVDIVKLCDRVDTHERAIDGHGRIIGDINAALATLSTDIADLKAKAEPRTLYYWDAGHSIYGNIWKGIPTQSSGDYTRDKDAEIAELRQALTDAIAGLESIRDDAKMEVQECRAIERRQKSDAKCEASKRDPYLSLDLKRMPRLAGNVIELLAARIDDAIAAAKSALEDDDDDN